MKHLLLAGILAVTMAAPGFCSEFTYDRNTPTRFSLINEALHPTIATITRKESISKPLTTVTGEALRFRQDLECLRDTLDAKLTEISNNFPVEGTKEYKEMEDFFYNEDNAEAAMYIISGIDGATYTIFDLDAAIFCMGGTPLYPEFIETEDESSDDMDW